MTASALCLATLALIFGKSEPSCSCFLQAWPLPPSPFSFWQAQLPPNSQICEIKHPGAHFGKFKPYCSCFCSPSHPHSDVPILAGPAIPQLLDLSLIVLIFAVPATHTPMFPFWQAWLSPNSWICKNEHPYAHFHKSKPYCPHFCKPSHPHLLLLLQT